MQESPQIDIGAVTSTNTTYRLAKRGVVGVRGVNRIADVTLRGSDGAALALTGLATRTHVWRRTVPAGSAPARTSPPRTCR